MKVDEEDYLRIVEQHRIGTTILDIKSVLNRLYPCQSLEIKFEEGGKRSSY